MSDDSSSQNIPPTQKAELLYQKGLELKNSGDLEAALTEFRRAALVDATHFNAQLEIGLFCKLKSKLDPVFLRTAFEAFRQASRLNLHHQEAHDNYIMAAQKLGRLDELLYEYDNLVKFNPENELLKRCHKNIVSITMALVPDKVNIAGTQMSGTMGKLLLFGSLGLILAGIGIMILPMVLKSGGKPSALGTGLLIGMGIVGLLIRSRLK